MNLFSVLLLDTRLNPTTTTPNRITHTHMRDVWMQLPALTQRARARKIPPLHYATIPPNHPQTPKPRPQAQGVHQKPSSLNRMYLVTALALGFVFTLRL